jgi:hypothetical protein
VIKVVLGKELKMVLRMSRKLNDEYSEIMTVKTRLVG